MNMSILKAYESGAHESNISHFAAIVKLASVDGSINEQEKTILKHWPLSWMFRTRRLN